MNEFEKILYLNNSLYAFKKHISLLVTFFTKTGMKQIKSKSFEFIDIIEVNELKTDKIEKEYFYEKNIKSEK